MEHMGYKLHDNHQPLLTNLVPQKPMLERYRNMNGDHDAYLKHRCWVSDTTKIRTCETNTNNTSSGNPISTHLATYTKARYQN